MRVDVGVGHHIPGRETIHAEAVYLSARSSSSRLQKRQRFTSIAVEKRKQVATTPTQLADQFASWIPLPDSNFDANAVVNDSQAELEEPSIEVQVPGEKRKYQSTVDPMAIWRPQMAEFLDEVIRHDGLGDHGSRCTSCHAEMIPNDVSSIRLFPV
ncbi:CxC2 domain-containing protein [Mycena chlorophos]|uniref:CxC2 domain-containing protein n=1 Tax=Mycena chlorophos TaxID=658473 RepID=A0A8H6TT48_MYCCL|nr:CxC2 domain-containing protein [Mycena chlorophos]